VSCRHCGQEYGAVRGPVYDASSGVGLYLAGMHRCRDGHGSVLMTISLLAEPTPEAFTIRAWSKGRETQMSFEDGEVSPWAHEAYLGRLLAASECRESRRKETVLQVADLICDTIPEVGDFLDANE
jgi:hypothetical protein